MLHNIENMKLALDAPPDRLTARTQEVETCKQHDAVHGLFLCARRARQVRAPLYLFNSKPLAAVDSDKAFGFHRAYPGLGSTEFLAESRWSRWSSCCLLKWPLRLECTSCDPGSKPWRKCLSSVADSVKLQNVRVGPDWTRH